MIGRGRLGPLLTFAPASLSSAHVTSGSKHYWTTQFLHFQIANPDDIGLWLSGYYNGKSGNLLLAMEGAKARGKRQRKTASRSPIGS
jgi:hypothetical protein